mmetsp:Transcript_8280/g.34770  ORF Transcript_8280/g.34770 Transcript_8280/m.34770 type:complete len:540 (+) Transcript_8280:65-1684(+)
MRLLYLAVILFAAALVAALPHPQARGPVSIGCGTKCGSMRLEDADVPPDQRPGIQNCTESWFTQTIDHFGFTEPPGGSYTYQQRYYVCDDYWRRANSTHGNGPIFFYTGNEADVTLYINNTGLMWQTAPEFGALLIFAEHRYYGQSLPFGADSNDHLEYLSSEQALADYAEMIYTLKKVWDCEDSAVIGFGGSYGGMLASWMRMKYPSALDGAIAASAPIMAFAGENPQTREEAYYRIVTRDATPIAQASEMCTTNVQSSWDIIQSMAETDSGRQGLQDAFKLCAPLTSSNDAISLMYWIQSAFVFFSEGNYPFPSDYLTNGFGDMPPHPMKLACEILSADSWASDQDQMNALGEAVSIYYNASHTYSCFDIGAVNNASAEVDFLWGYQWCTELMMPMSTNGVDDMFWPTTFSLAGEAAYCKLAYGVQTRPLWASVYYGGWNIESASNIVFSNGLLDPWSGYGVRHDINESVVAVLIPAGAHHLDLMWSTSVDPEGVKTARDLERSHMLKWVNQKAERMARRKAMAVVDEMTFEMFEEE